MCGRTIRDPEGVESGEREFSGLGLLPIETTFAAQKATHQVQAQVASGLGWMAGLTGTVLTGYEIHLGRTPSEAPWVEITRRGESACRVPDGAMSPNGRVWGCYLHGLFANDEFRRAWLTSLRSDFRPTPDTATARLQTGLDRLADAVAAAIPVAPLEQIILEGGIA